MIRIVDDGRYLCPVCGELSIYVPKEDLLFHVDGSDNWACWAAIVSRVVDPNIIFEPWRDCDCAHHKEVECRHGLHWALQMDAESIEGRWWVSR